MRNRGQTAVRRRVCRGSDGVCIQHYIPDTRSSRGILGRVGGGANKVRGGDGVKSLFFSRSEGRSEKKKIEQRFISVSFTSPSSAKIFSN